MHDTTPSRFIENSVIKLSGHPDKLVKIESEKVTLPHDESLFKILFYDNPNPMWVFAADTLEFLEVNNTAIEKYGYSREEFLNMTITDIRTNEDAIKLINYLSNGKENFKRDGLWKHIRKDGCIIEAEITSQVIDYNGKKAILVSVNDVTELHQIIRITQESEKEIARRERKYSKLIENSSDIISIIDKKGKLIYASPGNKNITGYDEPDLIGKNIFERIHPDDTPLVKKIYEMRIDVKGKTPPFEFRYRKKDGEYIYLEAIANNLLDDADIQGIVINARDITKRKLQELELLKFSKAIEHNPASIVITDHDANIKYVNPKFTELTGYTAEEVYGKNPSILKSSLNPPELYKDLWNTIKAGNTWRGEFLNRKKNGELYWESALIAPLKNGTNEVLNYIAVKEDITEKKLITAELKQRDKILQAASNAAENFLKNPNWETNISNILETIGTAAEVDRAYLFENYFDDKGNLQCRQRFEWTANGIESKLANSVIQNLCYRPNGFLRWKELLEKNEIVQGDIKDFPQKEKELLAIQSILSILIQPIFIDNHWWGFIGFDNCQTEKTWSAGLINALKVVADTFGSALYKNKVEQKLREEKEKAEEASKLKSNLMANMSHEIRTPMVGILGFTELLMEEIKDAHTKTIIETISTSAKRLMSTLESVLELSSLESSKIESHLEKTDIVPVLKTLTEGYKKIANNRSLELELFIKDKELISETDPDMLHKALSKLVDNAIKYTEYGNIVIKAESVISDNIRSIEINVADSGIGIPENYKHLVFEPFRQASEGYARKYEGIGLGLTLAKKYIELLGGSLSLDSSGNTGSRFIITIPVSSS